MESTLTYQTLYDKSIETIVSLCDNVPNISSLPSQLKAGYSKEVASIQGSSSGPDNPPVNLTLTIVNPIEAVSEATVRNAFQTFMSSRGVYAKLSSTVSGRGLINFMSNLAVFCRSYIAKTSSNLVSNTYTIFYEGGLAVNISEYQSPDYATAVEMKEMLTVIQTVIASNLNSYVVTYSGKINSSSSSSSSSSMFVAFMRL